MTSRDDHAAARSSAAASNRGESAAAITRDDGLTDEEGVVSDHIVAAVNAFGRMPRQHPQELAEFVDAVHRIQDLLAMRIARREYPKGWPTYAE